MVVVAAAAADDDVRISEEIIADTNVTLLKVYSEWIN
jgi:hypothetical protein